MTRLFGAALLLAVACSPPPELPARPPAMTTTGLQHEVATPPPLPPSFWVAQLQTTGGFAGVGRGGIAVRSDAPLTGRSPCRPPEERLAVESAVAKAKPELWKTSYKLAKYSGMTDQFYYTLHLRVREGGEEEIVYQTGWQDDSIGLLPADLRALYDALLAALEATRKPCP